MYIYIYIYICICRLRYTYLGILLLFCFKGLLDRRNHKSMNVYELTLRRTMYGIVLTHDYFIYIYL